MDKKAFFQKKDLRFQNKQVKDCQEKDFVKWDENEENDCKQENFLDKLK